MRVVLPGIREDVIIIGARVSYRKQRSDYSDVL